MLKIKNLKKVYGSEVPINALDNVSFEIERGEFVAIMGPSGSGKSTLLHILGLLDRPTSGKYWLTGRDVDEFSDNELAKLRNKKLGFVFQSFNLLPRTSVLDNVCLPLIYGNYDKRAREILAKRAIDKVNLNHRLYHDPSQLSGGEKQRVAIARALATDPDVILADEPTGNLDSKSSQQIMSYINRLHAEGKTILLITHENDIARHAQRVIKLKDGLIESDQQNETIRNS